MKKDIIKFLWKYLKEYKYRYLLGCFFVILASVISLATGYLNGASTEKITTKDFRLAIILLIICLIINIIKSYLRKVSNTILHTTSNSCMEKISYSVFEKVGLLPAKAYEEKSSGELINRVTNDSTNIISNLNQIIWILTDFIAAFIIIIYILFNSWIVFVEVIFYLVIYFVFTKHYMPLIKETEKDIKGDIDKTTSKVNESIRGVREIRALGIREKMNRSVKKDLVNVFKKRSKSIVYTEDYYLIVRNLNSILEGVVYITTIILLINNQVSLTFLIALTWYLYRLMYLSESASMMATSFQTIIVSSERLMDIIDNKIYKDMKFGKINKKVEGTVEFKNVSFKYSDNEANILNNFNLVVEKNKITALVGKSGGGKTTIFNLLLRYFDVSQGEILLDGINIQDFTEKSLSENISIIRQEPFIFNTTIFENFKIVDEKITLKKVREYCKLSEMDDYIMSLPDKYNTVIGEGGINLSGGQKQRLAIARALMKKSKILLLDEATSALDNTNQEKIKKVISKLSKNHTILIVAHRLSTIIDADRICYLEQGKIKISGTHQELLKKSKDYKTLYLNDELE